MKKGKLTLAELDEEEESLDRLRTREKSGVTGSDRRQPDLTCLSGVSTGHGDPISAPLICAGVMGAETGLPEQGWS